MNTQSLRSAVVEYLKQTESATLNELIQEQLKESYDHKKALDIETCLYEFLEENILHRTIDYDGTQIFTLAEPLDSVLDNEQPTTTFPSENNAKIKNESPEQQDTQTLIPQAKAARTWLRNCILNYFKGSVPQSFLSVVQHLIGSNYSQETIQSVVDELCAEGKLQYDVNYPIEKGVKYYYDPKTYKDPLNRINPINNAGANCHEQAQAVSEVEETIQTKPKPKKTVHLKPSIIHVKSITQPDIDDSKIDPATVEKIAQFLLLTGGMLINPIIVKRTGIETYELIEGEMSYLAAISLMSNNLFSGQVNCFIAGDDEEDTPLDLLESQISVFRQKTKPRKPKITKKRQEVIDLLKSGLKTAKKIAEKVGRTAHAVTQMLCAMFKARQITKVKHGVYEVLSEEQLALAF